MTYPQSKVDKSPHNSVEQLRSITGATEVSAITYKFGEHHVKYTTIRHRTKTSTDRQIQDDQQGIGCEQSLS